MTITTCNTVYIFQDLGDGLFEVIQGNPEHAPPGTRMHFIEEPEVGRGFVAKKQNHTGKYIYSSTVRSVEL